MLAMIKKVSAINKIGKLTTNHIYVPKENKTILLMPIPDFMGDLKCCQCKYPAVIMDKNFYGLCIHCLNQHLDHPQHSCKLEKREEMSYPSIERSITSHAFEWSTDNNRWYTVHGRNLRYKTKQAVTESYAKEKFYEIMEKILNDYPQKVEVDYDSNTKIMTFWI